MGKMRRAFSPEFKQEAVSQVDIPPKTWPLQFWTDPIAERPSRDGQPAIVAAEMVFEGAIGGALLLGNRVTRVRWRKGAVGVPLLEGEFPSALKEIEIADRGGGLRGYFAGVAVASA